MHQPEARDLPRVTYSPAIFDVMTFPEARRVILTEESDITSEERWTTEAPYLLELAARRAKLRLTPKSLVLDYGAGIGRMATALVTQIGCRVIGVDISRNMRALSTTHVPSELYSAVSPVVLREMVARGLRFDAALSIWVLQHCYKPAQDLELIWSALSPGARLLVVNSRRRAIPAVEKLWVDDGEDVGEMLRRRFRLSQTGTLDPKVVHKVLAQASFWGEYIR